MMAKLENSHHKKLDWIDFLLFDIESSKIKNIVKSLITPTNSFELLRKISSQSEERDGGEDDIDLDMIKEEDFDEFDFNKITPEEIEQEL